MRWLLRVLSSAIKLALRHRLHQRDFLLLLPDRCLFLELPPHGRSLLLFLQSPHLRLLHRALHLHLPSNFVALLLENLLVQRIALHLLSRRKRGAGGRIVQEWRLLEATVLARWCSLVVPGRRHL